MKGFFLLVLCLILLSCFEQGDCSDYSSNIMQVNFYSVDKKQKTVLIDSIKMEGWDTVMYKNKSLSKIILPLNPATDTMTYHFYYQTLHDTLGISYQRKTFALAPGCKVIEILTIVKTASPANRKATINQPELTSNVTENIRFYF